jgi:gluconate 5-dehydrogenase
MSLKEDMFDLKGKVALVTGAGLGLGRSFALTLASAGADLAIADINREGLDETGEMLKEIGGGVLDIAADVSNPADVARMVEAAVAGFGRLDVAVNNAGIVHKPYRFHETPLAEWDRLMSINLTGVFLCMQQEIAAMLKAQQGIVINISSILGVSGLAPAFMPKVSYIAAKHAVNGLTKQAALEYAGEGIRVNGIAPGWFEGTGLARERLADKGENFYRQRTQRILDATPMGRRGRVQELNGLLLYLASEASSFVTGQTFVVDGGWTC